MIRPLLDVKIILEVKCEQCEGTGHLYGNEIYNTECAECEGHGAKLTRFTLLSLKNLLEGGTL